MTTSIDTRSGSTKFRKGLDGAGHLTAAIYLDTVYFIDNPFKIIIKTEKEAGNGPVRPPLDPPMDTFT